MLSLIDGANGFRSYRFKKPRKTSKTIARNPDGILLTITQIKVFLAIRKNPYSTKAEIAKKLKLSKYTINKAVSALRKANKIKRVGCKNGYWEIIQSISDDTMQS